MKVDWLDRLTFREIEMINEVGCIPLLFQNFFSRILNEKLFIRIIHCHVSLICEILRITSSYEFYANKRKT